MRSEYVFAAAKKISNRFLLCKMTSVSARRMQIGSKQPAETINQSLRLIASAPSEQPREEVTEASKEPIVAAAAETRTGGPSLALPHDSESAPCFAESAF